LQVPHPETRRLAYLHAPNGSALGVPISLVHIGLL
jgi:hypothetical protein